MRDLKKELNRLIDFVNSNDNIRGFILEGSYINHNVTKDEFSDLDPLFYCEDVTEFTEDKSWKKQFGKPISFFNDSFTHKTGLKTYNRLVLYEDGMKIDFGFAPIELAKYANEFNLYQVIIDKDNTIPKPEVSDERNFYVTKPTEKNFLDILNEFFWDTSYIVKSLYRDELFFEKYMEHILQTKLYLLIKWYIGVNNDFKVNTGSVGRYFKKYLSDNEWKMLKATYSDSFREHCVDSLFNTFEFVHYLGKKIADKLNFNYPDNHEKYMLSYCKKMIKRYNINK